MTHQLPDAGLEAYRPVYHFTPPAHWINDPNGLVYYAGEYHLFYQYHPESLVWGPMHWGHAVSPDLLQWEHLPIALFPDALGTIFSGSAVIDWHNTAGFGQEAMIAVFTHDSPIGQRQSLAYSTDKGRTWTKYANNPVLATPPGEKDFRDPKVFWYDSGAGSGHWVMLLAVQDSIWFYTSPNLLDWHFASEFGVGQGIHDGVWETPDLVELAVRQRESQAVGLASEPVKRWVLQVGVGAGAKVDRQGTQYFVGHFDGQAFHNENPPTTELWADSGPDFYAAQGWNDAPDKRKLYIAWLSNWSYAPQTPATTWRGAMSLPRELSLVATLEGIRLVQQPVRELEQRHGHQWSWQNLTIPTGEVPLEGVRGAVLELIAEFTIEAGVTGRLGLHVCVGEGEQTTIGYDVARQLVFIDRTRSGQIDFAPSFAGIYHTSLQPLENRIRLHILLDHSSVEVFGNGGVAALTAQIFPTNPQQQVIVFSEASPINLTRLDVWQLV